MPGPRGALKVILEGKGPIVIKPSDYFATGGEGSIYRVSDTVIKLYADSKKVAQDDMPDKIRILSGIKHPYISNPKGVVFDAAGKSVLGLYADYVNGEVLPRVFTNDFRQREKFTDENAKILVTRMREAVGFAHSKNAIMVDANELNWLVVLGGHDGPEPRVIDVDSWAIGRWLAKVIMPSIRDWHSKTFNQMTDWFAWGIVTFQVFTGIHPYKGKLDGYKPGDLESRMKENKSVFTPGVRLNRAVRDFNAIPKPLLDWYRQTFQEGERQMPPLPTDGGKTTSSITQILKMVVSSSGSLKFEKLFEKIGEPVIKIWPCGIAMLESGTLIDVSNSRSIGKVYTRDVELVKVERGWLVGKNNGISFKFVNETSYQVDKLQFNLNSKRLMCYEDRMFVVTEQGLTELTFHMLSKPIVTAGQTWGLAANSTRWFEGVGFQDAMGSVFTVVPFSEKACAFVRTSELDGLKIINAKSGDRFICVIVLNKKGDYEKLEFSFNENYSKYSLWRGSAEVSEINMAILPKGVCATIVDDGEIVIFVPRNGSIRKINDKKLNTGMSLSNWRNRVVYIENEALWSLSLN